MIIKGEMAVMLGVLGLRQGDDRILDAIALVGPKMEIEEFDDGSTYYVFPVAGTDLLFEDGVLVAVIVEAQGYPRPEALVEGVPMTATRAEVLARLGKPERTGPTFERFEANGHYLHFEFDGGGGITKVSALLEAV
ncbi:hypothetical protein [Allokutzneria sp. NRRL B-24872]|uniref:hypothetical protein n=1 Tax=Allokutzneria sp. NRRL B-24872 TaxID=1137961 RepID=UPI000A3BB207|nr:hypothetical protein [Allokutzneria sp. NRRL B-24872]